MKVLVQSLSRVWLFATPWTAAHQASLFFTVSWSLLKLMSIEFVIPSNHLILCCPLLLDLVKQNSCMMLYNLSAFSATLKSSPWIQASESWVPWLWHISPIHLAPPQNAFNEPYRHCPRGSDGKEFACNAGDLHSIPGKIPWRRAWLPTPVVLSGEFHGQRSLVGYSP